MATVKLQATPGNGLARYGLTVDGHDVDMQPDNTGEIDVSGECGDQSQHELGYSLWGPVGSTLRIALSCGDTPIGTTDDIEVYAEGEPAAAGYQAFQL